MANNNMTEAVFKQLSTPDQNWVLYSMVRNIQTGQITFDKRLRKLENRKLIDRGLNIGSGAVGGGVTVALIWLKTQLWSFWSK